MINVNWIQGRPTEIGKYWLCMHDQGGWPGIYNGTIYRRLENAGEIWIKVRAFKKEGKHAEAEQVINDLPLFLSIPELCKPDALDNFWNIDAYAKFEEPHLPDWLQINKD